MATTIIGYRPNKKQIAADKKAFKDRKTAEPKEEKPGEGDGEKTPTEGSAT